MNNNDIDQVFQLYGDIIDDIMEHNELFIDASLKEAATKAWGTLKEKELPEIIEATKLKLAKGDIDLSKYGLIGSQWEYKNSVIDYFKERYDQMKDAMSTKVLWVVKKILHLLNPVLSSLLSATGVLGIELLKEFKDFLEATLNDRI